MTQYEVVRCADGHYRRVIYGLGPYIADYPEQALLACIVQGWCPRYASLNHGDIMRLCLQFMCTSCTAHPEALDDGGFGRSREHTDLLMDALDAKAIWDDYGVVSDIIVSRLYCRESIVKTYDDCIAIYDRISSRRHS